MTDTDIFLIRLRRLACIELIKSGIMTAILGTAGYFMCGHAARSGGMSNPASILALALAVCAVLYAMTVVRLMLATRRLGSEKMQMLQHTDQLRYLDKSTQRLIRLLTGKTKEEAHALWTEVDVCLTREIQKEIDPFEVTFHGE